MTKHFIDCPFDFERIPEPRKLDPHDAVLAYCRKANQGLVMRTLSFGVCALFDVNYFTPQVVAAGLDWFVVLQSLPALPEPKPASKAEPKTYSLSRYGRRY